MAGVFVVLEGFAFEEEADAISGIMLVLLIVLYCRSTVKRSKYFILFLVSFALAYFINYISWFSEPIYEDEIPYYYYGSNALFMLSYVFLILRLTSGLKLKEVFKELYFSMLILVLLDVFCVIVLTDTAKSALTLDEYIVEFIYNAVIMLLLSVALLNYMYRYDNKSMLFLVGSICIIFSEIIQLAYFYVLEDESLSFVYSVFFIIAMLFFYLQSQLQFTGPVPEYIDEQYES